MGEAKRRKQLDTSYGKRKNAIYIDTIFLNQALLEAYDVYFKVYPHLFTREEWNKRTNEINISNLVPFLVEYGLKKHEVTGFPGLGSHKDIDVFAFRCVEFWRGAYVKPNIVNCGNQRCVIKMFDVDLVWPSIENHIIANQSFKKYQAISMVCNDPAYDLIIKNGIKQGVSFMRYRPKEDKDQMTAPIGYQNIIYPIGRSWGLKLYQL